jgi:A/G-specific adenine glycosylase
VTSDAFGRRLLAWYARHGRKDLPWKRTRDPYRIWVSEIMLQQTQVATVIPYFERFLARFPDVRTLARARLDSVLHCWSGLGYYARARHLHAAAKQIVSVHGAKFPRAFEALHALPGVGRSTAGAILALAFGRRRPILDGNVKRVLTRYHAIAAPVNRRDVEEQLWRLAERHTPRARVADYTQAIMDLGATLCTRVRPACDRCPVRAGCRAHARGTPQAFPVTAKRQALPVKKTRMLLVRDRRGRVLLVRRPPTGLWGGLWGLPECARGDVRRWCRTQHGLNIRPLKPWATFRHSFSHFHLDIVPIPARMGPENTAGRRIENRETVWYNVERPDARGLAAPVAQLLQRLTTPGTAEIERRRERPSRGTR